MCVCVWRGGGGLEAKGEVRWREDNHVTLHLVAMVRELGILKAQPWKGVGPGGTSWSLWFPEFTPRGNWISGDHHSGVTFSSESFLLHDYPT